MSDSVSPARDSGARSDLERLYQFLDTLLSLDRSLGALSNDSSREGVAAILGEALKHGFGFHAIGCLLIDTEDFSPWAKGVPGNAGGAGHRAGDFRLGPDP